MTHSPQFGFFAKSMALLSCLSLSGLAQVKLEVPDSIAYIALYHVVYSAPAPHWDHETCKAWLVERGLSPLQAQAVIFAANRYMKQHAAIESELQTINGESRNSLGPEVEARRNEIETRRATELSSSIQQLRQELGVEGAAKLAELIHKVKSGIALKGSSSK